MASSKRRSSRFSKPAKGMSAGAAAAGRLGNVKAMDGVKEEERPDTFVEVVAVAAEVFERLAFVEELVDGEAVA